MSEWPDDLLILRDMGCYRPWTLILRGQDIFGATPFFLDWGIDATCHLGDLEEDRPRILDQSELATNLRRNVERPSRDRHQLQQLGSRKLDLQWLDQEQIFCLVDKIQLRSCRSTGYWDGSVWDHNILLHLVSWCCIPKLVGEHCVREHR
jgi:hypothetical protein